MDSVYSMIVLEETMSDQVPEGELRKGNGLREKARHAGEIDRKD